MNLDKELVKRILIIGSAVMFTAALVFVAVLLILGFSGKIAGNGTETENSTTAPSQVATAEATDEATPEPTAEVITYKEVNLLAAGDYLLYNSMFQSAQSYGNGTYDFSEMTRFVKDYISSHDFAAVNLEGVLSGENYSAYPTFRYPDQVIDTLKGTGFDMVLFANNHTYDYGRTGLIRTQEKLAEAGLPYIGTRLSTDEKGYSIVDVGGVKIGMLNYTYEAPAAGEEYSVNEKFLNGIRLEKYCPKCKYCVPNSEITGDGKHTECQTAIVYSKDLVYSYNPNMMERFYPEIEGYIDEMKSGGAEMIMVYMHWGAEYQHQANAQQKEIAQKLCDMGVDILIGGHPHVVQPVDTYTAADGQSKMLCYYSLGNFTSAQNRRTFTGESSQTKGVYTENELLASITVRKYSTGEVVVAKADYKPLWLHSYSKSGRMAFDVVPLDEALASDAAKESFGLNASSYGVEHATWAYNYIKGLVQEGIDAFNSQVVLPHPEAVLENG